MFNKQSLADTSILIDYLVEKRLQLAFSVTFLVAASALHLVLEPIVLIVMAAALIRPFRAVLFGATRYSFSESDWDTFSPIIANRKNPWFIGLSTAFVLLPLGHWYFETGTGWSDLGALSYIVATVCIAVFLWSECLYSKNFYFDRWHPLERISLAICGGLSVYSPVFVPLFLLCYGVITGQFRHPEGINGTFQWTHSDLPYTILLVISVFVAVGLVIDIHPDPVTFLLLASYASHYVQSGLAKLSYGPIYYLSHTNPMYLAMNAYQTGWMRSLDERIVLQIGKITDRFRPIINGSVVLIEVAAITMLFSREVAIIVGFLGLSLHVLIFVLTGDYFWKWIAVNLAVIVGLVLAPEQVTIFEEGWWILAFGLFVLGATAWMKPKQLGWLDSPYLEYFAFKATVKGEDEAVMVNPNIFRPYDHFISQRVSGIFEFSSMNPRITTSYGHIIEEHERSKFYEELCDIDNNDPLDDEEASALVQDVGIEIDDGIHPEELGTFLESYFESTRSPLNELLRFVSSPREHYPVGISERTSHRILADIDQLRMFRVDGLWTTEGFQQLRCEEVFCIQPQQ